MTRGNNCMAGRYPNSGEFNKSDLKIPPVRLKLDDPQSDIERYVERIEKVHDLERKKRRLYFWIEIGAGLLILGLLGLLAKGVL